jgi:hypothetical protein
MPTLREFLFSFTNSREAITLSSKWILLFCLILALFVGVVSADDPIVDLKNTTFITKPPIVEKPIQITLEPPGMKKKVVDYLDFNPSDITEQVKKKIDEILSPNKKNKMIENIPEGKPHKVVSIDGATIAIIPTDSKFINMEIHEVCLPFQYGTDRWYDCEVKYANR